MRYVVVLCDKAGGWHAIAVKWEWECAEAAFGGAIGALSAIDYDEDFPPSRIKIIQGPVHPHQYAAAVPLAAPVAESAKE